MVLLELIIITIGSLFACCTICTCGCGEIISEHNYCHSQTECDCQKTRHYYHSHF